MTGPVSPLADELMWSAEMDMELLGLAHVAPPSTVATVATVMHGGPTEVAVTTAPTSVPDLQQSQSMPMPLLDALDLAALTHPTSAVSTAAPPLPDITTTTTTTTPVVSVELPPRKAPKKRKPRRVVPDQEKTPAYWARRRKNTEAAAKSRQRKNKEKSLNEQKLEQLRRQKNDLKATVAKLELELQGLKNNATMLPQELLLPPLPFCGL
eukprot:m.162213 g.162213  ORF g.162213 m.162213 type:complete len:210 (+) comp12161_c0_seq1:459-1088(+)